jgi:hypothetical protein
MTITDTTTKGDTREDAAFFRLAVESKTTAFLL